MILSRRRILTDGEFVALNGTIVMTVMLHNIVELHDDGQASFSHETSMSDAVKWLQNNKSNQLVYVRRNLRGNKPSVIYFEDSLERERFEKAFQVTA